MDVVWAQFAPPTADLKVMLNAKQDSADGTALSRAIVIGEVFGTVALHFSAPQHSSTATMGQVRLLNVVAIGSRTSVQLAIRTAKWEDVEGVF